MTQKPLPPCKLARHWFVNKRGAINIEIEEGSNQAEIRVRVGSRLLVTRVAMHANDGSATAPQTWQWRAIAEACFPLGHEGWKYERAFA
jgi:hypothetical protein